MGNSLAPRAASGEGQSFLLRFKRQPATHITVSKEVLLLGITGAGKSFVGNELLGESVPPAGDGFQLGKDFNSCTEFIVAKSAKGRQLIKTVSGLKEMDLTVVDTPGTFDTGGRTTTFLAGIIQRLRENPPNGIILVTHGDTKHTAQEKIGLKGLAECFNGKMEDGRFVVFVNKLPTDFSMQAAGVADSRTHLTTLMDEERKFVSQYLGRADNDPFSNVCGNQTDKVDGVAALLQRIALLPAQPMNTAHFMTYTEVEKKAKAMLDDSIDKVVAKEDEIKKMKRDINSIKNDIKWHSDLINAMQNIIRSFLRTGATLIRLSFVVPLVMLWLPPPAMLVFATGCSSALAAGVATARACEFVRDESWHKVSALRKELVDLEERMRWLDYNLQGFLMGQKAKWQKYFDEIEDLKKQMDSKP